MGMGMGMGMEMGGEEDDHIGTVSTLCYEST